MTPSPFLVQAIEYARTPEADTGIELMQRLAAKSFLDDLQDVLKRILPKPLKPDDNPFDPKKVIARGKC